MIKNSRTVFVPQVIGIVMLLWALSPSNPYGYYILLRVILCAICAYLAFRANELERNSWVWTLGVTAFIYNPIIKIHLNREIWTVVNIVTIIVLALSFTIFRKEVIDDKAKEDKD